MLLLHLATFPSDGRIPLRRFVTRETEWSYTPAGNLEIPAGLLYEQVLAEPRLSQTFFRLSDWDSSFEALRPDVAVINPTAQFVVLIENKTVGADLGTKASQLTTSLKLIVHLLKHSWKAESLLLISAGYTNNRDLRAIRDGKVRLILWEDVLRLMNKIERFRQAFPGVDLSEYYNVKLSGKGWQG
jgi:hypothetical protein